MIKLWKFKIVPSTIYNPDGKGFKKEYRKNFVLGKPWDGLFCGIQIWSWKVNPPDENIK